MSSLKGQRNPHKREWVRTFEVGPARKIGNHMVYDVTSVLFPAGFPEAATRLTTTKRFSQFQKLHTALLQIHQKLYLKGEPPPSLPHTSYFNRFELQVLEERRCACLKLLEYTAERPILYSSQVFVAFLTGPTPGDQAAKSPSINSEEDETEQIRQKWTGTNESNNDIQSLTEKGDIMNATLLSTRIGEEDSSLPTPLRPSQITLENTLLEGHKSEEKDPLIATEGNINKRRILPEPTNEQDCLPEYLSKAADSIGLAIQFESEENWSEAVGSYRNAIGTLLTSVQQDPCPKRQASVKRRIASYLEKAEVLMHLEGAKETCQEGSKKSSFKVPSQIPHLDLFGKNALELRRYKVKHILSNQVVLAVQLNCNVFPHIRHKINTNQDAEPGREEVVIKTLQKSAYVFKQAEDKSAKRSLLPINVPFMAKLLRYYENDDFLHLVLEHVQGGELYKVVSHYFKQPLQAIRDENAHLEANNQDKKSDMEFLSHDRKETSLNKTDAQNASSSRNSQIGCRSPYSAKSISVIKPSASFVNIRKKSLDINTLTSQSTEVNTSQRLEWDDTCNEAKSSVSISDSLSSIDYVCTYTEYGGSSNETGKNSDLICVNKDGIERIACDHEKETTDKDESFDFVNEFADEEGQDVAKALTLKMRLSSSVEEGLNSSFELDEEEDTISAILPSEMNNPLTQSHNDPDITMTFGGKIYSEPVKLVHDSKSLLASVSSKLTERQLQNETAEEILSHLENVESAIQTHLGGKPASPIESTLATPYQHTPAKLQPSLLFAPNESDSLQDKRSCRNKSMSPLSPSTVATTPTSIISSPPKCSSSSSEVASPCFSNLKESRNDTLKLWDLVPYYDHINLRLTSCIPIGLIRKWAAQLCKALFSLHSRGIIVQDLRPCNLLLDLNGNLNLTYQCTWISIDQRVSLEQILDENDGVYCAPETTGVDYCATPAADWWSVGVILYELFVGDRFISLYPSGILSHTPVQFDGCDLLAMRKINAIEFSMSKEEKRYEESLKKLISGFLKTSPDDRLQEREVIKQHSFFKGVDWENLNQLV